MERVKVKFEVTFPTPISAEEVLYLGVTVQNVLSRTTFVLETTRVEETPTFSKAVYLVKNNNGNPGVYQAIIEAIVMAWAYGARIGEVTIRWIGKEGGKQNG